MTDCDRLDQVEAGLREQGILLWQVSPCSDTCSGGDLPDRFDEIDERHPGFRERLCEYAFFIDQNMPEMLAESTQISIYLAYGWFSPDDSEVAPDVYEKNALDIAHEICNCFREFLNQTGTVVSQRKLESRLIGNVEHCFSNKNYHEKTIPANITHFISS